MIEKLTKKDILNGFYNKNLTNKINIEIAIDLLKNCNPNDIVENKIGPLQGSLMGKTAGEALKEQQGKLTAHINILRVIEMMNKSK